MAKNSGKIRDKFRTNRKNHKNIGKKLEKIHKHKNNPELNHELSQSGICPIYSRILSKSGHNQINSQILA